MAATNVSAKHGDVVSVRMYRRIRVDIVAIRIVPPPSYHVFARELFAVDGGFDLVVALSRLFWAEQDYLTSLFPLLRMMILIPSKEWKKVAATRHPCRYYYPRFPLTPSRTEDFIVRKSYSSLDRFSKF